MVPSKCNKVVAAYSAALCRGLIEAQRPIGLMTTMPFCIPRLYAAASLKPRHLLPGGAGVRRIPRLYAAASLKRADDPYFVGGEFLVFRGSMPRPH